MRCSKLHFDHSTCTSAFDIFKYVSNLGALIKFIVFENCHYANFEEFFETTIKKIRLF